MAEKLTVLGARGASATELARKTGNWGVAPTDSDYQALEKFGDYAIEKNPAFKSDIPGPADNTYRTLAAFKASDVNRATASLVGVSGVSDGRFNWTLGNYSGQADDVNIIKADSTALSVGAWVRQRADGISTRQFGAAAPLRPVQDKLRESVSLDDYRLAAETTFDNAWSRAKAYLIGVGGGEVRIKRQTYRFNQTIEFDTGSNNISLWLKGEGLGSIIEQAGADQDVVRIGQTQRMRSSGMQDLRLVSLPGAGHCITIGEQGFEWLDLLMVDLEQRNVAKRLWSAPFGNMFYLHATGYWRAGQGATVSPVYIRAQDTTVNHNVIDITGYNSFAQPFFDIENEATATWLIGNSIRAVFQNCRGGGIRFANAQDWFLHFNFWDLNPDNGYVNDLILAAGNAGYESINCTINIKRNGSGMAGAARDVRLVAGQDFTVNCITPSGDIPRYDWGNKRVVVTGRAFNEESFNLRESAQVERRIFVNALAQSLNADVLRFGGLMQTERGTITSGGGFVEMKTTAPGTALILTALSGSNTEHKLVLQQDGASFYPQTSNFTSLGLASNLYSQVFAATGTINTSDERMKKWRGPPNEHEMAAAHEIVATIGLFQLLAAIEIKGDAARLHVGVKAQQVVSIMRSHGLDPFAYGFVCYDKWDASDAVIEPAREAEISSDGVVIHEATPERIVSPACEAGEGYGVRYDELAMFAIAGVWTRQDMQDVQIAALEARLSALENATPGANPAQGE